MVNPPPGKARGRSRLVSEENKALLARRFLEKVFNEGNLDAIDELMGPNRVQRDPAMTEELRGIEGARQLVEVYRGAFPDVHITVEDQVAEGDKIATRWGRRLAPVRASRWV
jgi:hypothetical protein